MAKIETKNIRNIALLGHGGSGKTTLAEAMLYIAKETDRLGNVGAGNTVCDYDPEEAARHISISASIAPLMWKNVKINVIDAPGYLDFSGEVLQATRVADSAVIVVDGKAGIEVGTELAWDYATQAKLPKASACIRCGSCTNACPFGLAPAQILLAYNKKDTDALKKLSIDTCMLCGCCSFSCPANRPLVQNNKLAKLFLREEKAKEANK